MSEKVKVPSEFADWISNYDHSGDWKKEAIGDIFNSPVLWSPMAKKRWLYQNWQTAIKAILNGYEVEESWFRVMLFPGCYLKNPANMYPSNQKLLTARSEDPNTIWTLYYISSVCN